MNWAKRIFISIGILVLVCLGGFIFYNIAYGIGDAAGYDKGYSAGQNVGYSLGKQEGHDEGYTSGKTEGYNTGYASGKTDGYNQGMEAGLGHGYTIKDPTYDQAVTFIREDRTNENKYVEDTYGGYVCSHFARDVCNNAEGKGLRCAFVELRFPDAGHSIIAFNTIDKGLVYFEPQSDMIAKPVIGKWWYQCKEPPPGYYYEKPSYDDTIIDILVIW
jgi:hypothetical protein